MSRARCPKARLAGTLVALVAVLACRWGPTADAAEKVTIGAEDWGLGGVAKSGTWMPLYLELTAGDEDFLGTLVVTANRKQDVLPVFTRPVLLTRRTRTRHWLYLRVPPEVMVFQRSS